MHLRGLLPALLILVAASSVQAALPANIDDAAIRTSAAASFPEYLELLAIPNDPIRPVDIQRNAAWLVHAFEKRGFNARTLPNKDKPLVFAERPGPGKTILFYFHLDGQPVVQSEWTQADAFKPVLKRRGADGKWQETATADMLRPDFDPELRVFARSASDDKAPIGMFLASLDLLAKFRIDPAVHVKVIVDSEEETNSQGLSAVIKANPALLVADALVIHDAAAHPSGRPTIMFGNRGLYTMTLTVYGPGAPLHSGHYGNYAPNPAFNLARLLASMKDDQGRVLIPGYYATTRLTEDDLKVLHDVGDDEPALRKRIGIADNDKVAPSYQEALQYPSLNIRGLASANVGDKVATIIPRDAVAELEMRTTVEANGAYLSDLILKHIRAQGYRIIDGPPSEEERQTYARLISIKHGAVPAEAARQSLDSPIRRWAESALTNAFEGTGKSSKPVLIRAMGATVPTHEIVGPLNMPFIMVPTVNADNNQHTYDENFRLGNYTSGMRAMLGLLTTPY